MGFLPPTKLGRARIAGYSLCGVQGTGLGFRVLCFGVSTLTLAFGRQGSSYVRHAGDDAGHNTESTGTL